MVILLSKLVNINALARIKAPKGLFFEITDVHIAIFAAGSNEIGLLPYEVEDVNTLGSIQKGYFAFAATDIANNHDFEYVEPVISKYITAGLRTSTAASCYVIVNGRFKSGSKTDMIIEWFRKGR